MNCYLYVSCLLYFLLYFEVIFLQKTAARVLRKVTITPPFQVITAEVSLKEQLSSQLRLKGVLMACSLM